MSGNNLFSNEAERDVDEEVNNINLVNLDDGGDTMRNEAGEAYYDSARNLMDEITDSHASIHLLKSPGSSKRSRGSKSRKGKSKKSHTSIVLEEPSKEDRGLTGFCSRYSVGVNSQSLKSSFKHKSSKAGNLASSINISIKNSNSFVASGKSNSPIRFRRDTSCTNTAGSPVHKSMPSIKHSVSNK